MLAPRRLISTSIRSNFIFKQTTVHSQLRAHRLFHASTVNMVQVGDSIPNVELFENSPGNKVNIAQELASGNGLIVGVPAAFSPACTASHVPGYINSKNLSNAGKVFVVSVNDPFVMKAWAESLDPGAKSGIRFLGDPHAEFTKKLGLTFDSAAVFGNDRSKRYAIVVDNGKVKSVHEEPDNTGVDVSAAEKVLA